MRMLEVMNPGTRSRPQYEGMVGLGAQRLTICRERRSVQSILDLFANVGYNPARRLLDPSLRPRSSWHDAGMTHARIEFETDVFSPSGLTLLVDGAAQSHVDPV